jgi:hypothetical protein
VSSRARIRGLPLAVLALAGLLAVAACGSTPAASGTASASPSSAIAGPGLATSLSSSDGTAWAVVQMGGSAAQFNNFWELFVRPAGAASWKLATPLGVASNGGLVIAQTGPGSLLAGFRPSQDLTFSPLAATANAGAQWSQNTLLSPGLSNLPDALAGNAGGRLLALTDVGGVDIGARLGTTWTKLTTQRALASTTAGRACSLTALTAAAWAPAGTPLVAGDCRKHAVAGIFAFSAGAWRLVGPALPASVSGGPVDVVGLATTGSRTTAILAAGTSIVTAWSKDGGTHWTLSPVLRAQVPAAPAGASPSVSIWADGSAGLVLSTSNRAAGNGTARRRTVSVAATIGWRSASWRTLPSVPAGTATLAAMPGGELEALAVSPGILTAWQLDPGASRWTLLQTLPVTIPYGSSG